MRTCIGWRVSRRRTIQVFSRPSTLLKGTEGDAKRGRYIRIGDVKRLRSGSWRLRGRPTLTLAYADATPESLNAAWCPDVASYNSPCWQNAAADRVRTARWVRTALTFALREIEYMLRHALNALVSLSVVVAIAFSSPMPALASNSRPVTSEIVYGGPVNSTQVMVRASDWLRRRVPYSQDNAQAVWDMNRGRRYRPDCSGFVSMTWALDPLQRGLGRAPVTWELPSYAIPIGWRRLHAGDILLRVVSTNHALDHVQLFERWVDSAHTRIWVLEESGRAYGIRRSLVLRVSSAGSGYVPYRYRKIY